QYAFSEWRILPRFAADVELVTGIAEAMDAVFAVYPNPARGEARIAVPADGRSQYALLDATGRAVLSGTLTGAAIDLAHVAPGRYALVLRGREGVRRAQLVVE
ncbi:MAG: T9SS type A sorting domain-containing protein, partial [Flavobacteriales bacterium]